MVPGGQQEMKKRGRHKISDAPPAHTIDLVVVRVTVVKIGDMRMRVDPRPMAVLMGVSPVEVVVAVIMVIVGVTVLMLVLSLLMTMFVFVG